MIRHLDAGTRLLFRLDRLADNGEWCPATNDDQTAATVLADSAALSSLLSGRDVQVRESTTVGWSRFSKYRFSRIA